MSQRIAYGALAIGLLLLIICGDARLAQEPPFAHELLRRGSFIPLTIAVLAALAALEMTRLLRARAMPVYETWAVFASVAVAILPWFVAAGWLGSRPRLCEGAQMHMFAVAVAFLGAGFIGLKRQDVGSGLAAVAGTWLIIGYVGFLAGFLTLIRADRDIVAGDDAAWVILVLMLVCKSSDIGAYFTGSFIGRHKLIPSVSPGKTIEGALGGITFSVAVTLAFRALHQTVDGVGEISKDSSWQDQLRVFGAQATLIFHEWPISQAIVFAVLISIVGQAGDLLESLFKRSAQVKDSGAVLPTFGGILDIIDSPLAVAPVAWLLLTNGWPFA